MKNKLKDYVFKIDNFLNKKICEKTILELKKIKWFDHQFYQEGGVKKNNLNDGELDVSCEHVSTKLEIMNKLHSGIHKYIKHVSFDWFTGWSGYSDIRFNRYFKNKRMKKHCDHIHTLFDGEIKGIPTLSIIGTLNDNYTGGELIFFDDTHIKLKAGELVIFPSNFLYPHKIEPVKQGTRYSYVSWVF